MFTIDQTYAAGLPLLTDFRFLPDGRIVAIAQSGEIWLLPAGGGTPALLDTLRVDIEADKGLLGLAVDPRFTSTRRLFFYYSLADDAGGTDVNRHRVVARILGADDVLQAGETVLVAGLRGPANHSGGALDVGPDDLLYVGVGDQGCNSGLPPEPPVTPTNFYPTCLADDPTEGGAGSGKILRIQLDGAVPPTNPLVGASGVTACGETCGTPIAPDRLGTPRSDIFAWGFREPFRLWIDPVTGLAWVGDVGEVSYEEIDVVHAGRHYGWPWREGPRGHPSTQCQLVRVGTAPSGEPIFDQPCVDPVFVCHHDSIVDPTIDGGCTSITGGQIVDSCTWPASFRGRYVFADNVSGALWTVPPTAARDGVAGARADFATIDGTPVALHTGPDGALYVAAFSGRIARIAPIEPSACVGGCRQSSDCDDGNPCTDDSCDVPTAQCHFLAMPGCTSPTTTTTSTPTSSTTLPPHAECTPGDAAQCADDDACTADTCGPEARCTHVPLPGVRCRCQEVLPTCGTEVVPRRVVAARGRACALADRIDGSGGRRQRRLARRAARRFRQAARAIHIATRKGLDPTCGRTLETRLRDAAARAAALVHR
jgi:glucose/arabinose dehydrogenase